MFWGIMTLGAWIEIFMLCFQYWQSSDCLRSKHGLKCVQAMLSVLVDRCLLGVRGVD